MISPLTPEAKRKLHSFRLEVKSIILISLGVAGLVIIFVVLSARIGVVHHQAQTDASRKVNALGCQILSFADEQYGRAVKSYAAAAASPATTSQQKATNAVNLAGQKAALADAHHKLRMANIVCPVVKAKTKTGTKTGTDTPRLPSKSTVSRETSPSSSVPLHVAP